MFDGNDQFGVPELQRRYFAQKTYKNGYGGSTIGNSH